MISKLEKNSCINVYKPGAIKKGGKQGGFKTPRNFSPKTKNYPLPTTSSTTENMEFTPELAEEICNELACGMSLRKILMQKNINPRTLFGWLKDDETFFKQYSVARELQAEMFFEQLDEICDVEEDVNRAQLKVHTRKWMLSKMLPERFGDTAPKQQTNFNTVNVGQAEASPALKALISQFTQQVPTVTTHPSHVVIENGTTG